MIRRLLAALLALALFVAIGLPILAALLPPVADALGSAGSTALIASAILTFVVGAAFLYTQAHAAAPEVALRWDRRAFLAGGIAAIVVLLLFPAQLSVFALAWPPPETAEAYFDLIAQSRLVGLLSLDLLLMFDWIVLLVVWTALFAALRPTAPRTMLVVATLVILSTLAYFVSNTAFDMVGLSDRYASAASGAERASLLVAGESALATFEGPWFTASYVLSGLAALLASAVMWRDPRFGRVMGGIGIVYGLLQLVPPNYGTVGMAMSLASLPVMLVWIGMIAWKLLRLSRTARAATTASRGRKSAA